MHRGGFLSPSLADPEITVLRDSIEQTFPDLCNIRTDLARPAEVHGTRWKPSELLLREVQQFEVVDRELVFGGNHEVQGLRSLWKIIEADFRVPDPVCAHEDGVRRRQRRHPAR
jgi:hypothetical protein